MKISKIYKCIRDSFLYSIFEILKGKKFRINLIIIGGQRCGSTSMINFLSNSKEIVTPKYNEQLFFFSHNYNQRNNFKSYHLKFLHNFYKKKGKEKIFAERTPDYCLQDLYMNRIYDYNSEIKIIFIFREPYQRIKSAFDLNKELYNLESFESFLNNDEKYFISKFSFYCEIYQKIFKKFKVKNVLIIDFKELNNNNTKIKISKFLNIDLSKIEFPKKNSFKKDELSEQYISAIKKKYGDTLDRDYSNFLKLYKEYEAQFKKIYL